MSAPAIAVLAVVAFVIALIVWVGRQPSASNSAAGPAGTANPSLSESVVVDPYGSGTASGSGARSGSGTAQGTDTAQPAFPALPNLTSGVNAVTAQGHHQVVLEATSDTTILAVRFGVRNGSPATGQYVGIASPFRVFTPAQGNSTLAVLQVESAVYARGVDCTISIDGVVRSRNHANGGHAVAVCVA